MCERERVRPFECANTNGDEYTNDVRGLPQSTRERERERETEMCAPVYGCVYVCVWKCGSLYAQNLFKICGSVADWRRRLWYE